MNDMPADLGSGFLETRLRSRLVPVVRRRVRSRRPASATKLDIGQTEARNRPRPEGSSMPNSLRRLAMILVALSLAAIGCSTEEEARVRFVEPADGATVSSPLRVVMSATDFIVEPAANGVTEGHGHLHIMVDAPCVQARLTVPPDSQHLHFGNGQTETELDLAPGEHFLCLQAADGSHTALRAVHEITIVVE